MDEITPNRPRSGYSKKTIGGQRLLYYYLLCNILDISGTEIQRRLQIPTFQHMSEGPFHMSALDTDFLFFDIKLTCNSFTISDGEMQDVGVGLYPSMSLLNHSCDPNCVIVFDGTRLHLRTVKEIPQGEELTISYMDVKMPSHMRQMQCQRQYCFTCDCHRCMAKDKDEDMLAGGEDASRELEHSLSTLEELRSHGNLKEALNFCKKMINSNQLPNKNIHQLKALDIAMDLCIQLKMWDEALQYAVQTLEPYSLYYSNYHPVRAIQIMKVGKLQLHLGILPDAMTTLMQAFQIMKVTHGRDHCLTQELMELLGECEMGMEAI